MTFPLQLKKFSLLQKEFSLFAPDEFAVKESYRQGKISFPYWAQVWPSAVALALFLLQHPHFIGNKKLVEIGAGLGLPSIIAAPLAASVSCSDMSPEAVAIIQQSANHNQLNNLHAKVLDWHTLPSDLNAEVILLSDVNYDPAIFEIQIKKLNEFLEQDMLVLLSTPQRLWGKDLLTPLLPFCQLKQDFPIGHNGEEIMVSVFVFGKSPLL